MRRLVVVLGLVSVVILTSSVSLADDHHTAFQARLTGFQEVPPKLTTGHGRFTATLDDEAISYQLTYADLSSEAQAAHIHFAQRGVNGGIIAFLCGGGNKPACPPNGGTVSGTITPDDILAVPDQGVTAGDFAGVLRAIRSGITYVNVHTTQFPAGEIRGQIQTGDRATEDATP
jgi:hypothetical protein